VTALRDGNNNNNNNFYSLGLKKNNNNNNQDNVYGAVIIARVHLVHLMNVEWRQAKGIFHNE